MEYYYMISMNKFWELDSSIINYISQKRSKDFILVSVTSELTDYIEEFETLEEMSEFANQNDFWLMDPIEAPLNPYIPELDDPMLK